MRTGLRFDTSRVFADEFTNALATEQYRTGFKLRDWFFSGRMSPENSVIWWEANGPTLCQRYIDWYESNEDVSVWVTPDGIPAIELPLEVRFGSTLVRMVIDQVLVMGSALVVVDLKSGSKTPDSLWQLGQYACGIELRYGKQFRPRYGTYFMHRGVGKNGDQFLLRPIPLDDYQYSIEFYSRQFTRFRAGIASGAYVASPGKQCDRCPVAHACLAVGGKDARRYDPEHPQFKRH